MTEIQNSIVEETLRPYGVSLKAGIADQIRFYISLLLKWNRTISLTTITDPIEMLKFHFGESMFAASAVDFSQSRLADVGAGAGFPGIPLAIFVPGLDVTLIESNSKKSAFLSEVVRELRLKNVTVFRGRMEDFPSESRRFDFIAARALGHHNELLRWAKNSLMGSGRVVLWLGEADSLEISGDPGWSWDSTRLIPGSERRNILVGSPKSQTAQRIS